MDIKDFTNLTVYTDLLAFLKERGFSDEERFEVLLKLTAEVEIEVTEELMKKLSKEQLQTLENLPVETPASEIAEKLGLDPNEIDAIRSEKTAQLIDKMMPSLL